MDIYEYRDYSYRSSKNRTIFANRNKNHNAQ